MIVVYYNGLVVEVLQLPTAKSKIPGSIPGDDKFLFEFQMIFKRNIIICWSALWEACMDRKHKRAPRR